VNFDGTSYVIVPPPREVGSTSVGRPTCTRRIVNSGAGTLLSVRHGALKMPRDQRRGGETARWRFYVSRASEALNDAYPPA
jgi:hypothetical protein